MDMHRNPPGFSRIDEPRIWYVYSHSFARTDILVS